MRLPLCLMDEQSTPLGSVHEAGDWDGPILHLGTTPCVKSLSMLVEGERMA